MARKKSQLKQVKPKELIKLNLGSGMSKMEGYIGVDSRQFENVDLVHDLREPWPWDNESVEHAHCSHFIEHLEAMERVHFVNELYRVLIPGGQCQLIMPHWASNRAYGDLTHKWPPVSEMWFYYLKREWREMNAPHNDFYECDFDATWAYSMREDLHVKNQEMQQFALQNYKECALDTIATLIKPMASQ